MSTFPEPEWSDVRKTRTSSSHSTKEGWAPGRDGANVMGGPDRAQRQRRWEEVERWHFKQTRLLRLTATRHRDERLKVRPWGLTPWPPTPRLPWHFTQVLSRWHPTHAPTLRFACTAWRFLERERDAVEAQFFGWNFFLPFGP